ncbi:phytoene/squalene synthase family protein [Streptomyces sp. JJ36]|uniref:phytoene/squalene synthase family protein n=1 Tax=Streptomyces sp. JJ36 TaxID=2736645 RepID=UPI001F19616E|nr:phytoene/squalene synthase family protein [Streptomyces sp. JJ36]MCF6525523.1 phytoene/squalene synthase family protein [Streptomyces sp. JJ36]
MTARELDAAGIRGAALRAAYTRCRRINAGGGKTYFLATRLLTPRQRPAVHALYGFARHADDIVDDLDGPQDPRGRAAALDDLEATLRRALASGRSDHPVLAALADTVARYRIDPEHFAHFMRSMRMDLRVTRYPTFEDLRAYMHGSAAVIGLQVLPVLDTVVPREEAAPHAASLGIAFQLTNFLRDVGEDLDRDRVYLPEDRLAAHGVDRELLRWCRRTGRTDRRVRAAVRDMNAFTRGIYRHAALGIPMLHPVSRPCVRTAYHCYQAILDRIEAADCAVLHRRAVVPGRQKAAVVLRGLGGLARARLRGALTGDLPRTRAPDAPADTRPGADGPPGAGPGARDAQSAAHGTAPESAP